VDQVVLGRTGLVVSVVGLGCGGDSHLGLDTGGTIDQAINVIRRASELGVNYFDTADEYGTEELVGRALSRMRDEVVISTKSKPRQADGSLLSAVALKERVHASLKRLRTDRVELFFLHMVRPGNYQYCLDELLPALDDLVALGTIGHIGITEGSRSDPSHSLLVRAVEDDAWEAMMLAFNPFNQSARQLLLPKAIAKNIGIDVMCATRGPFSHPDEMRSVIAALFDSGALDDASIDHDDPIGFVVHPGGAASVIDAAYRYARHEPGCHVVLTGTGDLAHLEQNIVSINRGPLPAADVAQLERYFGSLQRTTKD